jgi:hypothetical protein
VLVDAATAAWPVGTELVAIDGEPVESALASLAALVPADGRDPVAIRRSLEHDLQKWWAPRPRRARHVRGHGATAERRARRAGPRRRGPGGGARAGRRPPHRWVDPLPCPRSAADAGPRGRAGDPAGPHVRRRGHRRLPRAGRRAAGHGGPRRAAGDRSPGQRRWPPHQRQRGAGPSDAGPVRRVDGDARRDPRAAGAVAGRPAVPGRHRPAAPPPGVPGAAGARRVDGRRGSAGGDAAARRPIGAARGVGRRSDGERSQRVRAHRRQPAPHGDGGGGADGRRLRRPRGRSCRWCGPRRARGWR